MIASESQLDVGIIGAGIGGLSAAIALREAGHKVTVYERTHWTEDGRIGTALGNGLSFGANAGRILESWGFDFAKAKLTPLEQERTFHGQSLKQLKHFDFGYYKTKTGQDWVEIRRSRLSDGLLEVAQRETNGIPINIQLGVGVKEVDCARGKICLDDGTVVEKDLVIAADGLHSHTIHTVTEDQALPLHISRTAFRFEIPNWKSHLGTNPGISALFTDERLGMCLFLIPETKAFFLTVPADKGDILFGLIMHPAIEARQGSDQPAGIRMSREELVESVNDFHPTIQSMVELAENPVRWTIATRDTIGVSVNERVALVGDACHPHLPHHGQGGSSAMEDAASLGVFFSQPNVSASKVPEILRTWQNFRLPRARTVHLISTSFPAPKEELEPRIRDQIGYKGDLPENFNGHEEPIQLWLFNYDVRAEAKKYLANDDRK